MSLFSLREASALIPAARIIGDASVRFERVSTDSRTVAPGELFVALKGERFDAHDFLPEAVKRGAVAALVSRDFPEILLPALKAPDTCAALGLLARGWRRRGGAGVRGAARPDAPGGGRGGVGVCGSAPACPGCHGLSLDPQSSPQC